MSEKGKYRVNLVHRNDVSELMSLLKDFKWSPNSLPTNYLIIDIIEKHASKVPCEIYNGHLAEIYRLVTYEKMIEILSNQKDLGDNAKNSLSEIHNTIQKSVADDAKKLLDKIQSSTFEELDARTTKAHEKETLKHNLDILNDHLLNGTRIQFKHSGEQWHNVTGKFKLEQLKNKSIKLRVRPDRVSIDGYMFTPQQAIDYINRNYDNG